MFALTIEGGMANAFPDVCQTPMPPPVGMVPIPYPNIAQVKNAESDSVSEKVFIKGQKALTVDSKIPQTNGDEAGVGNGLVSQTSRGPAKFLMGSFSVFIEGSSAVRMGDMTAHNGDSPNAVGSAIAPSQTVVSVLK